MLVRPVGLGQGKTEADGEKTHRKDECGRDHEIDEPRGFRDGQQIVDRSAEERGRGVEVAAQDHGDLPDQHVADDPASDGGDDAAEEHADEAHVAPHGLGGSDGGEDAQPHGVAELDDLGTNNKLFYPETGANIGPCRAYFQLDGITAADLPANNVKMFFGERPTLVSLPSGREAAGAWYTIDGRKVQAPSLSPSLGEGRGGLPSGIYIHKGKKVIIK